MVPDPEWHLRISLTKSVFRMGAGVALACSAFAIAGLLFILAEVLGVVEELV